MHLAWENTIKGMYTTTLQIVGVKLFTSDNQGQAKQHIWNPAVKTKKNL